jgi:tetratricopeptide (TPR) repeat protein
MQGNSNLPDVRRLNYLDFELEIGLGSGQEYPVVVVRSPAGEARETMHFPFGKLELENQLQTLQIALLRSGGKRRRTPSPEEQSVQDFGQALFDALLTGEVRNRYDVSQRQAAEQSKGLRLKLRIQPPGLAALPWEFLYDSRQRDYVCLSLNTPAMRYLELPQVIQPLSVIPPLRILGMVACPSDLPPLDVAREKQRVEEAIKGLRASGLVELTWLDGQTWRDLQWAMSPTSSPWHVFHFIGHGGFDQNADEGLISLADEEGKSYRLHATELGRLLADHRSLRLVLLNSCEGARGSERDIFSSTAAILVGRSIPAVLAMQYEITDQAAVEFASTFYRALAAGMPVDAAVAQARKAVSLAVINTVEWGTPVLYMRSPDGLLFNIQAPVARDKRQGKGERKTRVETKEVSVQEVKEIPEQRGTVQEDTPGSTKEAPLTSQGTSLERSEELYNRGIEYSRRHSWKEAVAVFTELVQIDPGYEEAWQKLREATEKVRKFEDLERLYRASQFYLDKKQWESACIYLKRIVESGEQYEDAAALLKKAEEQLKLQTLYTDAEARIREKKWGEAVVILEEIVGIDQTYRNSNAKLDQARVQCRLQNLYKQAVEHFSEERWAQAIKDLEMILKEAPDYPDAVDKLKEARKQHELTALYSAAVGLQETRRWEEAIDKFTEIIQLAKVYKIGVYKDVATRLAQVPRQQELDRQFKQGENYLRQEKWKEAVREFERVYTLDPSYLDVQVKLDEAKRQLRIEELRRQGEASLHEKNWQEAVKIFKELRKLDPMDSRVVAQLEKAQRQTELERLYQEGIEYLQRRKWRKAQESLDKVVRIDPNYPSAAAQLEIVRERLAQGNRIIDILRDPLWQGVGAVLTVIALIVAVYPFVKGAFNPATPTPKPETLCNGDFEKRNFECWEHGGELRQSVKCEGDQCYAVLGSPDYKCEGGVPVGEAWIKQSFLVPETVSPTLSLRYQVFSHDLYDQDFSQVKIDGETVDQLGNKKWSESSCTSDKAWDSGWQFREFDLSPYKGQIVELSFHNVNGAIRNADGAEWWNTWTYVDDVEIH